MIVFASLFTALITLGAYISIPIGPVPFVLQNFFVFLAALLLGYRWGTLSVVVYLLLGLAGLPVFSQGRGGFLHLIGPTGGYLFAYIPAVLLSGFVSEKGKRSPVFNSIALVLGALVVYLIGVPWLAFRAGFTWDKAIAQGALPFLIPDAIKIAAAVIIAQFLSPLMDELTRKKGADAQGD
jgi:biotin transport system substrate-specific component